MNKITFVIATLCAAACAPAPPEASPLPSDEVAAVRDGRVVHATGAFSLTLPQSVREVPVQGIDSAVDQFEASNYTLMTDYGMYSCGFEQARPGETVETATIDGRSARISRYRDAETERPIKLTARFNGLGANPQQPLCLAAHAQCADDAACDAARAVIDSIDFD